MSVESINKDPVLFLAPIQGITEFQFRNAFVNHFGGIDLAISPFFPLVDGKKIKRTVTRDVWPEVQHAMELHPQIMGKDADLFIIMAKEMEDMGYTSINWNLGCPVHVVTRKQRGSGMLPHPEMIDAILERVIPNINIKLSIKSRIGFKSADEIVQVLDVYNKYPLDYLVIHPRIGKQMYRGEVDLETMDYIYQNSRNTLVYSGDLNTMDDYHRLTKRYPNINNWMLGRGLFHDMFLAERIKGLDLEDAEDRKRRLFAFLYEIFNDYLHTKKLESKALNKIKEHWFYVRTMLENGDETYQRIKTSKSLQEGMDVLKDIEQNHALIV